ncbi:MULTISPECIES: TetR/AcrR family transcriptional regulator [Actinoalloteichus]|uniref:Transcriptional regulator, TetR family n=1 Tax=Actinoalloteichus fjordicus TaxID=1612552 RepID=A0AAC9LDX8_9PSEU|nr:MULTISPECIES: TetR/AcrR family transcriptional regulator [Actinoalloteichus]APU15099.1 transcriptional regulator, TetR family [Actinoalloteichus fjordicus]APU21167.1 transcriptional regulator, TetR family [Actinoalloteichus sp. GBA129-24]
MPRHAPDAQEILDVAHALVLRHGAAKASMNDIARAAGVSKGLLYLRFESRDELLDAMVTREFARLLHALRDAALADDRGGLLSQVYRHSASTLRDHPLLWTIWTEASSTPAGRVDARRAARVAARIAAGRRYLARLLDAGVLTGDLDGTLTEVLTTFTLGLSAASDDPEATVRGMAALVAGALEPPDADIGAGKDALTAFVDELLATTTEVTT